MDNSEIFILGNDGANYWVDINGTQHPVSKDAWMIFLKISLDNEGMNNTIHDSKARVLMCMLFHVMTAVSSIFMVFSDYFIVGYSAMMGMGIGAYVFGIERTGTTG